MASSDSESALLGSTILYLQRHPEIKYSRDVLEQLIKPRSNKKAVQATTGPKGKKITNLLKDQEHSKKDKKSDPHFNILVILREDQPDGTFKKTKYFYKLTPKANHTVKEGVYQNGTFADPRMVKFLHSKKARQEATNLEINLLEIIAVDLMDNFQKEVNQVKEMSKFKLFINQASVKKTRESLKNIKSVLELIEKEMVPKAPKVVKKAVKEEPEDEDDE